MIGADVPATRRRPSALTAGLFALGCISAAGGALLGLDLPLGGEFDGKMRWWLAAVALGFGLGGVLALRGAVLAGGLACALTIGGAAQLWLTQPLWFPTLRLSPRGGADVLMTALVFAQAAVAAAALVFLWNGDAARQVFRSFGAVRIVILVALCALFSVSIMNFLRMGDEIGYMTHLVAGGAVAGVNLLTVLALAAAPHPERALPSPAAAARLSRAAPAAAALAAAAGAAMLAWFAFRDVAHVEDETAYLFQAATFAGGALWAPALPDGAGTAFEHYLLEAVPERWFATTAPGWPAALALGVLAGAPWLVNPLLGGLAVWLGHRLTERHAGRRTADLAALLMACSPWLLGISASLMTHALSLALTLGGWLLLTRAWDADERGRGAALGFAAGALMGWLFLTRPLEALLMGGGAGLLALVQALRLRRGFPVVFAYGAGCIAAGALLFPYNALFTGDPLVTPLNDYIDRLWGEGANAFGFGPAIGPPPDWGALDLQPGHSPFEGAVNAANSLAALNLELFGWGTGSLALVWAFLLWGRSGGRGGFVAVMLTVAAAVVGAHFFYWFSGAFYVGPRYWYGAFFPLVILTVTSLDAAAARLEAAGVADARRRLTLVLAVLCVFGAGVFAPWRGVEKYAPAAAEAAALRDLAHSGVFDDAVVILSGKDGYQNAAILNDPFLRSGRPVFVRETGPEGEAALAAAFPDRRLVRLKTPLP